jgi:hypothetical protein
MQGCGRVWWRRLQLVAHTHSEAGLPNTAPNPLAIPKMARLAGVRPAVRCIAAC